VAEVAADGPFSAFPGIDRTLTVIAGAGIDLAFEDGSQLSIDPLQPTAFDGGIACQGRLKAGPLTDLNVMSCRGAVQHAVAGMTLSAEKQEIPCPAAATLALFAADGAVAVTLAGETYRLAAWDSLLIDAPSTGIAAQAAAAPDSAESAHLLVIAVSAAP